MSTVLLSVDTHVGGMVSGGLGQTDKGNANLIGGYTLEFFVRVCKKYNRSGPCYTFEPHVASVVFHEMLNEAKVNLVTGAGVVSVSKSSPTTLSSITTLNGTFSGKVFTDASYEGDLLPLAGISYTVGREAVAEYNESTNGRMAIPNKYGGNSHQFDYHVNATDPTTGKVCGGGLLFMHDLLCPCSCAHSPLLVVCALSFVAGLQSPAPADDLHRPSGSCWGRRQEGPGVQLSHVFVERP